MKLIDFGLALRPSTIEGQVSTQGPRAQTTIGKTIAGTLHYAAPEQMGQLPGVAVGAYSDVYGFGKSCYYALLNTSEPDDEEKESLPEAWRKFLSLCTRRNIGKRLPDFATVLAGLAVMRQHPEPGYEGNTGSDEQTYDEKYWLENHPVASDCARWYRDLLTRFHRDVREKFGKTVITLYVGGKVRVAVFPKRNDRALVSVTKLNKGDLAEAAANLTREGIEFTDKNDRLRFDVNLQQLKEKQAAHESIAGRLLPVPPSHGDGNDEEPEDTGDKEPETSEAYDEKHWLDNYPAALNCARWYRELLTRFHRDTLIRFGKTVITLYVGGLVRVAVRPRKNDRVLIDVRYNEDLFAEAVEYLKKARVAVTPKIHWLDFNTDLNQLKEKQAAHEWIVGRLLL